MNTLPPWNRRYNFGLREHKRQQDAANQGSNVAPATPGIDLYTTPTSRGLFDTRQQRPGGGAGNFGIGILSPLIPGGLYSGYWLDENLGAGISPSASTIQITDVAQASPEPIYVFNLAEEGRTTHDLVATTNVRYFAAWWWRKRSTDGVRVALTWGLQWSNCSGGLSAGEMNFV